MDTIEAIKQRRAVKHYDAKYEMPKQDVDQLLALTRLAPTAFNQQNYRFVMVKDKQLREQIKQAAHGQAQVTDASLLIIICADTKAWEKQPLRCWQNAPQEANPN